MENNELAFIVLVMGIAQFICLYIVYKNILDWIAELKDRISWLAERFYEEAGYIMNEIDCFCGDGEDEEEDAEEGTTFASTTGSSDIVTIKATNSDPNNWTVNNGE